MCHGLWRGHGTRAHIYIGVIGNWLQYSSVRFLVCPWLSWSPTSQRAFPPTQIRIRIRGSQVRVVDQRTVSVIPSKEWEDRLSYCPQGNGKLRHVQTHSPGIHRIHARCTVGRHCLKGHSGSDGEPLSSKSTGGGISRNGLWWWCLLFVLAETKNSLATYTLRVLSTKE